MKTYRKFICFVSENYGSFIFAAVFYSLWLVYKYALVFDPQLLSFPGRMIGEATLNAYDINKRINVFYRSGFIFFLSISFFSFISWRVFLFSQRFLKSAEVRILNYTSLAGITFYFFNLWTDSFYSSYELIYCIHKVVIAGFILKWLIVRHRPVAQLINVSFYSIAFVLGVSVFFILNEMSVLFHLFPKSDFLVTLFSSVVIALIIISVYIKEKSLPEAKVFLNRAAFLLIPIAWVPVFSFLKDEVYLILNRHEIYYFNPGKLYLLFLFCSIGIVFWRYRRFKKGNGAIEKNNEQLVALRYFPLLVVGLVTYTFYNPYTADLSNEMFEAGNQFLPVMEFQKFGVIPIFEKFNSHVLSELFFGSIYVFFNGLHSREMCLYDFLYQIFWAFMVYHFVYRISRNAYIALFVILLFPLIDSLLEYPIIALLAVFMLDKVIREKPSYKNYFLLIATLSFLLLWRVDIGYPSIIAACATLFVYLISREQFRINWKLLFKTLGIFTGIVVFVLLSIGWCRHVNVFEKIWSGFNYIASAQTYGHVSFGDNTKSTYKIQYFVFPLVSILGLGAMLVFVKKLTLSKSQRFIYSSFLFLIVYYFVNFQRGLVRHSFIEGYDNGLSAFAFFIFSGGVFLFCQNRSKVFRLISFLSVATFLIMNYKFPAPEEFRNLYSKTIEKADVFSAIEPRPNIVRYIDTIHYEETHFRDFKKLVSKCLNDRQTFIDFANKPMLYYLTEKISPSYFYQNPLTIHNDYLQKSFLAELPSYDAPLLVFSGFPKNEWDKIDGVPNTMRHYRLAEYFYRQYKPFAITDNLCIWKRNDFKVENKQDVIFSYSTELDTSKTISNIIKCDLKKSVEIKYMLKIRYNNNAPEVTVNTKKGKNIVNADFSSDLDHTAYYLLKETEDDFSIELFKTNNIRSVLFTGNEFIPDFYSCYPQKDDLQQLPYIWATYDDSTAKEKVLLTLSSSSLPLVENKVQYFNFSPSIDKASGNTILISLEVENDDPLLIELMFGSSKNGFKGAFGFKVPTGKGLRNFAVRISSQYNWYDPTIDYIALVSKTNKNIVLKKVTLLKAE